LTAQETPHYEKTLRRIRIMSRNPLDRSDSRWTDAASETIDQQRENVSSGLDRAASTLHEKAADFPGGPRAVRAAHRVADGMEATASYLREHDLADMRDDVVDICRRHPVQTLISAAAFGFLLGRALRR
jgi:hypothetical protein